MTMKLALADSPDPATQTILQKRGEPTSVVRGRATVDRACPVCGAILLHGVGVAEQKIDVVFRCFCGTYSEMPH